MREISSSCWIISCSNSLSYWDAPSPFLLIFSSSFILNSLKNATSLYVISVEPGL